jgi:hypothetical protein
VVGEHDKSVVQAAAGAPCEAGPGVVTGIGIPMLPCATHPGLAMLVWLFGREPGMVSMLWGSPGGGGGCCHGCLRSVVLKNTNACVCVVGAAAGAPYVAGPGFAAHGGLLMLPCATHPGLALQVACWGGGACAMWSQLAQ